MSEQEGAGNDNPSQIERQPWFTIGGFWTFLVGLATILSFAVVVLQTSKNPDSDAERDNGTVREPRDQVQPVDDSAPTRFDDSSVRGSPAVLPSVPAENVIDEEVVQPAITVPDTPKREPEDQRRAPIETKAKKSEAPAPAVIIPPLRDIGLAQRLCESGTISVTFQPRHDDNRRYQQLGGAATVQVKNCVASTGKFSVPGSGYKDGEGTVGRNSLSFEFIYYSLQRNITCKVTASRIQSYSFPGAVSCEGSNDELSSRPAIIDI